MGIKDVIGKIFSGHSVPEVDSAPKFSEKMEYYNEKAEQAVKDAGYGEGQVIGTRVEKGGHITKIVLDENGKVRHVFDSGAVDSRISDWENDIDP